MELATNARRTEAHTTKSSDGTEIYFETHGDRSNPAIFMGPHFYPSRAVPDDAFTDRWIESLECEFYLITADYPRGIGRTRNPQGLKFSAAIAAEEYECVVDALGIDRFGWLGYSFGGAMGVQVACRTARVAALAVGGFPPLNAPFQPMLNLTRSSAENPQPLPPLRESGIEWSTVAFYASLINWPERQEVSKLRMPRLAFIGDEDTAQGSPQPVPLAEILRAAESDLRALGWDVHWLQGQGHGSALNPEFSLGVVRRFFRQALLPT
jgi:pimeloyl-ACP methyl ester carboxylesterase